MLKDKILMGKYAFKKLDNILEFEQIEEVYLADDLQDEHNKKNFYKLLEEKLSKYKVNNYNASDFSSRKEKQCILVLGSKKRLNQIKDDIKASTKKDDIIIHIPVINLESTDFLLNNTHKIQHLTLIDSDFNSFKTKDEFIQFAFAVYVKVSLNILSENSFTTSEKLSKESLKIILDKLENDDLDDAYLNIMWILELSDMGILSVGKENQWVNDFYYNAQFLSDSIKIDTLHSTTVLFPHWLFFNASHHEPEVYKYLSRTLLDNDETLGLWGTIYQGYEALKTLFKSYKIETTIMINNQEEIKLKMNQMVDRLDLSFDTKQLYKKIYAACIGGEKA